MRNSTFSRLALFGLAAVSSFSFAATTVSGMMRFDANFNTEQKANNDTTLADAARPQDSFYASRYRLDFKGDIAKSWTFHVRLANDELSSAQLDLSGIKAADGASGLPYVVPSGTYLNTVSSNAPTFSQAYASWSGIEGMKLSLGALSATNISSDNDYYKPYIGNWPENRSVGNIVHSTGNKAGVKLEGMFGPVGYSASIFNQTNYREISSFPATSTLAFTAITAVTGATVSRTALQVQSGVDNIIRTTSIFDAKSLRLGYGARLTFSPKLAGSYNYGVGVGYNSAPMYMPVVTAVLDDAGSEGFLVPSASGVAAPLVAAADIAQTVTSFNTLNQLALDAAATFGALQVNAGYESIQLKKDVAQNYNTTAATRTTILDNNGKATSFWIEAGYLLMGDSYKFNSSKALISGVKLRENQAGLELAARFGQETRKGVIALLSPVGLNDFSLGQSTSSLALASIQSNAPSNQHALVLTVNNDAQDIALIGTPTGLTSADVAQITTTGDDAGFQTRSTGYVINLNYYVNDNACIKAEYESRTNKFMRATTWLNSMNNYKVSTLRVRAEFSF